MVFGLKSYIEASIQHWEIHQVPLDLYDVEHVIKIDAKAHADHVIIALHHGMHENVH